MGKLKYIIKEDWTPEGTGAYLEEFCRACAIDAMPSLRSLEFYVERNELNVVNVWDKTDNRWTEVVHGSLLIKIAGTMGTRSLQIHQNKEWIEIRMRIGGVPRPEKKTLLEVLDAQVKPWDIAANETKTEPTAAMLLRKTKVWGSTRWNR